MIDVVLPVLNEEGALPWLLERMPADYRPIVADNGSTDTSAAIAERFGAMVVREPTRGFGAACHAGLAAATSNVVCFMDADGSLDPTDLPLVAGPVVRGEADLALGARIAARGAWPVHARMANRVLARRLRRTSGAPLTDLGPMRAAQRQPLLDLRIRDRRFGWPLEMVLLASGAGWRITEIPVPYRRRIAGSSKVTGSLSGTVRTIRDMTALMR